MSKIILPEPSNVVQPRMEKAEIGGIPIDYQAEPSLAVQLDSSVLRDAGLMLGHLSFQFNIIYALIREVLTIRGRIEALEGAAPEQPSTDEVASDG